MCSWYVMQIVGLSTVSLSGRAAPTIPKFRRKVQYLEFEEGQHKGIILGDSGYALKGWLMTPVFAPKWMAEERYKWAHHTTRTVIERCNGILKRRFHCLHGELRVSPERACHIVAACTVLHNHALDYRHPLEEEDLHWAETDEEEEEICSDNNIQGNLARNRLINTHFTWTILLSVHNFTERLTLSSCLRVPDCIYFLMLLEKEWTVKQP